MLWSQASTTAILLNSSCQYFVIRLMFPALPHFTRVPSDQTAWEGEEVSFPCEADGTPKPIVFWTMEGSQVCCVYNSVTFTIFFSNCKFLLQSLSTDLLNRN